MRWMVSERKKIDGLGKYVGRRKKNLYKRTDKKEKGETATNNSHIKRFNGYKKN